MTSVSTSVGTMTTSPTSSSNAFDLDTLIARRDALWARIEATGRTLADVTIVAVTKTYGPDAVRAAASLGLRHVGENYLDEMELTRSQAADAPVTWHYQGVLQRNKIARLVVVADVIESVARLVEIDRIARERPGQRCKIQVDFTGRPDRGGCEPGQVATLVERARGLGLALEGLMTVAPTDPQAAAAAFDDLRRLADDCDLPERSMGMSGDLEMALRAGATQIRVGAALFGPREPVNVRR